MNLDFNGEIATCNYCERFYSPMVKSMALSPNPVLLTTYCVGQQTMCNADAATGTRLEIMWSQCHLSQAQSMSPVTLCKNRFGISLQQHTLYHISIEGI